MSAKDAKNIQTCQENIRKINFSPDFPRLLSPISVYSNIETRQKLYERFPNYREKDIGKMS